MIFLNLTPKAKETKEKHKQVELFQTKNLLHSKENHQQNEKATMEWEKIFANHISDKGLISKTILRIHKTQ